MKRLLQLFCLVAMQGCIGPAIALFGPFIAKDRCPVRYGNNHPELGRDITRYGVPAHMGKSQLGVPIGPGVDGAIVDAAFLQISDCLGIKFQACGVHAVMVAPDWSTDQQTGVQNFPCRHPDPAITSCKGVNQWPATIVTTPNMYSLGWEVSRLLLGGEDPDKKDLKGCWQQPYMRSGPSIGIAKRAQDPAGVRPRKRI